MQFHLSVEFRRKKFLAGNYHYLNCPPTSAIGLLWGKQTPKLMFFQCIISHWPQGLVPRVTAKTHHPSRSFPTVPLEIYIYILLLTLEGFSDLLNFTALNKRRCYIVWILQSLEKEMRKLIHIFHSELSSHL